MPLSKNCDRAEPSTGVRLDPMRDERLKRNTRSRVSGTSPLAAAEEIPAAASPRAQRRATGDGGEGAGPGHILARNVELAAIESFVDAIADGPAALVLEGSAGIGKTTLWTAGVRSAERRGHRVLQARPTEAEAAFSFAALGDLLGDAFASLRDRLPGQQERALAAALLVSDDDEPADGWVAATAAVSLLDILADERPLVVAVDDVQWLDAASRRSLEFALRRVSGRVGVLAAVRAEAGDEPPLGLGRAFPETRLRRLPLGPLSLAALHHLLRNRLAISIPRPILLRVATVSGGNPFFALEIARVLAGEAASWRLLEPLPLTPTMREVVAVRVAELSAAAREAGLVVASALDPTIETLRRAMSSPEEADAALAELEAAEVLVADGDRLRFTHPLLASGVYGSAPAVRRRRVHRRLAALVDDAEERGIHLARALVGVDGEAADAMEHAAHRAALRGAPDAAAELFEAALRSLPNDRSEDRARILLARAKPLYTLGSLGDARTSAEQALAVSGQAPRRADALSFLASLDWFDGAAEAATAHFEHALQEVANDAGLQAPIYAKSVRFNVVHDVARAIREADAALAFLEEDRQPALVAHVLVDRFAAGALRGEAVSRTLLQRGIELEERAAPSLPDGPHPIPLIWFHCADEVDAARRRYAWEQSWFQERGGEVTLADRSSHLAMAELRAGRWEEAERLVEESCAVLEHLELRGPRATVLEKRALVDAYRGRCDLARDALQPLVESFDRAGQHWWAAVTLSTLAFTERVAGDDGAADDALARMRAHARAIGVRDMLFDRSEPYELDSLLERGELEHARATLGRLEERERSLPRPWIAAALPGARALMAAAEGATSDALIAVEGLQAEATLASFEVAWSCLAEGRVRRRAKQKRAAADALSRAASGFERVGAPTWAARARRELERVGLRRVAADELTPSESRVAELAASGLTNREIAKAAFVSVKTVEANLARAYRKLGIRSRTELAARIARARAADELQS